MAFHDRAAGERDAAPASRAAWAERYGVARGGVGRLEPRRGKPRRFV